MPAMLFARKFPIGAELVSSSGAHFRVWAPRSKSVSIEFFATAGAKESQVKLEAGENGYFSGLAPNATTGDRYKIKLDHGSFPDPASRFQPEGPHGPSEIIDPAFAWTDGA